MGVNTYPLPHPADRAAFFGRVCHEELTRLLDDPSCVRTLPQRSARYGRPDVQEAYVYALAKHAGKYAGLALALEESEGLRHA